MALTAAVFGMCMFLEGWIIVRKGLTKNIKPYWMPFHYIFPHTYAHRIQVYNQFKDFAIDCEGAQICQFESGWDVIKLNEFEDTNLATGFLILFLMTLCFRFLFYTVLRFRHTRKK